MSDFYEGRMIPLKIADAAVISCNKEIEKLQIENARLKAEVERLKSLCDNLGMGGKHTVTAIVEENARLKAEVERLRKAGDALAETLEGAGFDSAMDFWNAAKEGKPTV